MQAVLLTPLVPRLKRSVPRIILAISVLVPAWAAGDEVGSKACSGCHAGIYRKYSASTMSQSSGIVGRGEFRESFDHAIISDPAKSAEYRLSPSPEGIRLDFKRSVTGTRMLGWFVGSGRVARSYLSALDGFLFQSPVSYYSAGSRWDLSPGYQQHDSVHLTRAVGTGCLQCHASRLQPVTGTQNGFAPQPFLEGGISCERCHGPGKNHVTRMSSGKGAGSAGIVNPVKLDPARRDSVCAQCHLTGAARVARLRPKTSGKGDYQPGGLLQDYTAYFVWSGSAPGLPGANSHFEKLAGSACKKAAGDKLWCGSCHDPHGGPPEAARVHFYRARCQKCPQPQACKAGGPQRQKLQDDCTACHMPKSPIRDTEHAVFTDHSIPRKERPAAAGSAAPRVLTSFWKTPVDDRDLGLAYVTLAGADPGMRRQSFDLLRKAEMRDPSDVLVLAQLAQLYDQSGDEGAAMSLSERVVRLDPAQVAVAVNLGTYYIKRGRAREAMRLWADTLARSPGLTSVRMNLAVAQYQNGDSAAAEATLLKAIAFDPDQETIRQLLAEIRAAPR